MINRHTLSNGLRIVHYEDTTTQMVAVNVLYDVGARDEDPARTGYAHLLEHLMFEGSIHIPDYDTHVQLAGGENNAWTSNDLTNYYITLPRTNVETAFWLESDRMMGLALTEQSVEVQKDVVIEEFKQQHLNRPYGDVQHLIRPMAYKQHHYQWPTIGICPEHIEQATLEDVMDFYHRFYVPSNAILSVVGNISAEETFSLAEKWFGPIPRREITPRSLPQEKPQTRVRRKSVRRNVPANLLAMAFHMPCRKSHDYHTCDLITDLLSAGHSSRLIQHLIPRLHKRLKRTAGGGRYLKLLCARIVQLVQVYVICSQLLKAGIDVLRHRFLGARRALRRKHKLLSHALEGISKILLAHRISTRRVNKIDPRLNKLSDKRSRPLGIDPLDRYTAKSKPRNFKFGLS